MTGTPVRVLLTRHGETVSNCEGRWQGQSDSPLTERGLAQAHELARALASEPLTAIYSSDLPRAFSTAQIVAEPHGLPVSGVSALREIATGQWTGRRGADVAEEQPDFMAVWRSEPWRLRLPGGETLAETQERALAFLHQTLPAHVGQTVLVVTHGTSGQCILAHALGRSIQDLWLPERFDNCQIARLTWSPESGFEVDDLCDVRHLAEVGSLRGWRVVDAAPSPEPEHTGSRQP